jgi:hypothetical protein
LAPQDGQTRRPLAFVYMAALDDSDQKPDPAGHIPRFYFTFQRMLRLKLGATAIDCLV